MLEELTISIAPLGTPPWGIAAVVGAIPARIQSVSSGRFWLVTMSTSSTLRPGVPAMASGGEVLAPSQV